jgi:hypothetical protein
MGRMESLKTRLINGHTARIQATNEMNRTIKERNLMDPIIARLRKRDTSKRVLGELIQWEKCCQQYASGYVPWSTISQESVAMYAGLQSKNMAICSAHPTRKLSNIDKS